MGQIRVASRRRRTCDGILFDSRAEMVRYQELKLLEKGGVISSLKVHPRFVLQPEFMSGGSHYSSIVYEGDFEYRECGIRVVEDVKGFSTAVFRLKRKLFLYHYPQIEFRIIPA